jgi:hypothetical protein
MEGFGFNRDCLTQHTTNFSSQSVFEQSHTCDGRIVHILVWSSDGPITSIPISHTAPCISIWPCIFYRWSLVFLHRSFKDHRQRTQNQENSTWVWDCHERMAFLPFTITQLLSPLPISSVKMTAQDMHRSVLCEVSRRAFWALHVSPDDTSLLESCNNIK